MDRSNLMYVGAYTRTEPHVVGQAQGIRTYAIDAESGKLSPREVTPGVENPSYLAIAPSGQYLYAVCEIGDYAGKPSGGVASFAIDAKGDLTLLNQQISHGVAPCYVSVDDQGRFVLVANYGSGVVAMYPVAEDGSLREASCVIQHEGSSINPKRQTGPHAHSITIDPSNNYALAADLGIDRVLIYRLDADAGQLVAGQQPWASVTPGTGPRHFAFHPTHRYGYLILEMGSAITCFEWEETKGALTERQMISTLPADFTGSNSCADIHVHPSGRFVYGSNRGHDSIAIFAVDEANGELTLIGHESTRGRTPRNFTLDAQGRYLYAANQDSHTIVTFAVDGDSGLLAYVDTVETPSPVCLKILARD